LLAPPRLGGRSCRKVRKKRRDNQAATIPKPTLDHFPRSCRGKTGTLPARSLGVPGPHRGEGIRLVGTVQLSDQGKLAWTPPSQCSRQREAGGAARGAAVDRGTRTEDKGANIQKILNGKNGAPQSGKGVAKRACLALVSACGEGHEFASTPRGFPDCPFRTHAGAPAATEKFPRGGTTCFLMRHPCQRCPSGGPRNHSRNSKRGFANGILDPPKGDQTGSGARKDRDQIQHFPRLVVTPAVSKKNNRGQDIGKFPGGDFGPRVCLPVSAGARKNRRGLNPLRRDDSVAGKPPGARPKRAKLLVRAAWAP